MVHRDGEAQLVGDPYTWQVVLRTVAFCFVNAGLTFGIGLGIALQSRHAIQLELDFGLLATIRPRGGLPKRAWYVVRTTIGPNRESVEAFTDYVTSPAARHALDRAHGDEVQQTRRQLARRKGRK